MKIRITLIISLLFSVCLHAQDLEKEPIKKRGRKGKMYFYWGWNEGVFSKSDIHFKGNGYDFTLYDVVAKDRQSKFGLDPYFKLNEITIPQYNFRLGYFINDKYNISIGADHMKYVVKQGQMVTASGYITNSNTSYDGVYNNTPIQIKPGFLQFEHTDGLNFLNTEIRRVDDLFDFNKLKISLTEGVGFGVLYPKTNTTLLNKARYDEFHIAGYGLDAVVGLNLEFFKYFFIQGELKGGFINMPNIRTTMSTTDKASQHFFFAQANIVFGAIFSIF